MSPRSGDASGPSPGAPSPHPTLQPAADRQRDARAREETREGAAARGAHSPPASGNSRVTARRRRAPRGEAVADRWRLRTGSAHCAPRLPNRPPATRSARQSARVRWWVRSLRPSPRPPPPPGSPHPYPTLLSPFRLRHPPVPYTQDENALPGTTQQRLDGFGHGPAVAYPQHHLQPLCLGESLPAAAPLASVTAAPLCLSGSRRMPLRTRRAASQALALGCRAPPIPPILKTSCRNYRTLISAPIPLGTQLTVLARTPVWHAFLWLEHFLLGMSHSGFSPSPFLYPQLLCCRERTMGLLRCPFLPPTSPSPHPFQGPVRYAHTARPPPGSEPRVCAVVTRCLSCARCCAGFIGLANGSYSLVSSLLPSPKGWLCSLLLGPLITFPLRGPEASGAA